MPQPTTTGSTSNSNSPVSNEIKDGSPVQVDAHTTIPPVTTKIQNKRQRLHNLQNKQRQQHQKTKHNQLASPPQDQVSSTQDQVGPTQDDHDCQTSPLMLITTQVDDDHQPEMSDKQIDDSLLIKHDDQYNSPLQTQSSPINTYASTTITTSTTTSTSPPPLEVIDSATISSNSKIISGDSQSTRNSPSLKRRKIHNNSDHDTSSATSWSSSYNSPPSPISTSSTSSISTTSSNSSETSSCSSSTPSPSSSPLSSPDIINELKRPRLKLSEQKIRKIKKRPILFDEYYTEHSFASTPTTSSGCSPGQHSNTTQNSDQSRIGISTTNMVIHMFQAPPKFVNNLKPCNLPAKPQEPPPSSTPPAQTKEMLNCAICGIKKRPPKINKVYGQNSCLRCTRFFVEFLEKPQQLYCAQDGDCLMTIDSRCRACWIKICLQKFHIEEEHRKVGQKYSPKLLSSPNVSLITIDTSLFR